MKTTYTSMKLAKIYMTRIVCLHGVPRTIVSDRGTQFISKFWHQLHQNLGTRLFTKKFFQNGTRTVSVVFMSVHTCIRAVNPYVGCVKMMLASLYIPVRIAVNVGKLAGVTYHSSAFRFTSKTPSTKAFLQGIYPDIPLFEFCAEASQGAGNRKKFHGY